MKVGRSLESSRLLKYRNDRTYTNHHNTIDIPYSDYSYPIKDFKNLDLKRLYWWQFCVRFTFKNKMEILTMVVFLLTLFKS